ncbi:MAG: HEAT repeat domain-containing protein, partial [Planctomycetes bacterium]|nr:HEAT repeat domain-containing protein [Planctomycetota bacterium]
MAKSKYTFLFCISLMVAVFSLFGVTDDLSEIKQTLADKSYANYWDRLKAINKLKAHNSKDAAMILVALFDDEESPVRESALMILGDFTDKNAVDYLVTVALNNPKSKNQRFYTAWVLGMIKDETARPYLLRALNTETDEEALSRIIR